jgi:LemA protein
MWLVFVLVALLILAVLWLGLSFNGLVARRNRAQSSWAQIDVQLEQRHDLVPNLVATVKGYAEHERDTFEQVADLRTQAVQAQASGPAAAGRAEGALVSGIGRLFAVAEAYPELRASEQFRQLQQQLAAVEQKIAIARQIYNDTVATYNTSIQRFPTLLIAGPMGFKAMEYFQAGAGDDAVPSAAVQ